MKRFSERGYPLTRLPGHPRARKGVVFDHILAAERVLGRHLPAGAVVHHVNGKADNRNIVICESQGYHMLLHRRARALAECGDPNKSQCYYCRGWDTPEALGGGKPRQPHHRACAAKWQRDRRAMRSA